MLSTPDCVLVPPDPFTGRGIAPRLADVLALVRAHARLPAGATVAGLVLVRPAGERLRGGAIALAIARTAGVAVLETGGVRLVASADGMQSLGGFAAGAGSLIRFADPRSLIVAEPFTTPRPIAFVILPHPPSSEK